LKIAFVYDAVYPWVKGGAEKRIYELGKRLAKNNEVHIFGVKWWNGNNVIKNEGMVLHGVCKARELYVNGRRSISEAIIFSIKLLPSLIMQKFDVIDVSAFPYFPCFVVKLVSILKKTPMIITWHEVWGSYWYEYLGKYGFAGRLVEFIVSKLANKSIVVSNLTKRNLELLGVNSKNIFIIPNGIDLKRIANVPPSSYEWDIIFVGRLIKEKNVDMLIEAMDYVINTLQSIRCHIVGNGPEKERLMNMVAERRLNENIHFSEFMEYDEVIANIKSSKLLVLPSAREGFGIVVIEAYACGVPVVTIKSKHNAAYELVSNTGLVVEGDAKQLGDAILMLINNNKLREEMSRNARNKAKDYDWERIVDSYEKLIRK